MAYVDGFVAAVPTANKEQYIAHATTVGAVFKEHGAVQYYECWGDDVPEGEVTSMPQAVQCKSDETVCFGWVLWPSRDVRNSGMEKVMQDPRCDPSTPFSTFRLSGAKVLPHQHTGTHTKSHSG